MDEAARLEPHIGVALQAAVLTNDREAPLKRDMVICTRQSTAHQSTMNQLHSPPRPRSSSSCERRKPKVRRKLTRHDFPRPATIQPLARLRVRISRASSRSPQLSFPFTQLKRKG
jgi:hypothetical protein